MKRPTIWQWLLNAIDRNQPAALMVVVRSHGSSPGKTGDKMALTADGESFGTIGGGLVEYDVAVRAMDSLKQSSNAVQLIYKQHRPAPEAVHASGHICGGEQWLALLPCGADQLVSLQQLQAAHEQRQPLLLRLGPQGLALTEGETCQAAPLFDFQDQNNWYYQETIGHHKTAYIIGGGHVSLALSKILAMLDFDITVIDERPDLETLIRNTDAHRKLIVPYSEINQTVPEGDQVFVFIMTHEHKLDEKVAELLAARKVAYLGLLGSRKKVAQVKANLAGRVAPESLASIHAPIGLPIHSHTPTEIAISIAAELIQLSNAKT